MDRPGKAEILSSVVYGQADLHAAFGGVVPEIAARAHAEKLDICVAEALVQAGLDDGRVVWVRDDGVAVGPTLFAPGGADVRNGAPDGEVPTRRLHHPRHLVVPGVAGDCAEAPGAIFGGRGAPGGGGGS